MRILLGIDIGTQGAKGALVSGGGEIIASHSLEHSLSVPRPGWAEHDAEKIWWGGFVDLVRGLVFRAQVDPRDIAAIGISALSPAVVPLDAAGRSLRPAILYSDTRAGAEITWMTDRLGLGTDTGLRAQDAGPKILWFREHEPERWRRTRRLTSAHGYVVAKLTGRYTIDVGTARQYRPFFDAAGRTWDTATCDLFELPIDLLPDIVEATDVVGGVTAAAAAETGLAEGTPVIGGITDFMAEAVSTGAAAEGDVIVSYGTTLCLVGFSQEPIAHCPGLWSGPHLFGDLADLYAGRFTVGGGMATSAALTRWFRDHFGQGERRAEQELGVSAYGVLGLEAESVPPGAEGLIVLPYFSGERSPIHDPLARGAVFGLTLAHGRGHVYRALLEGVAYGLQHHIQLMRETGMPLRRIVATGGGARSQLWTQIVSDVTGLPQEVVVPSNAALGTAFLAGNAVGIFREVGDVRLWARSEREVQSRQTVHNVYQEYYAIYRQLYDRTKEEMHALAKLGRTGTCGPNPRAVVSE